MGDIFSQADRYLSGSPRRKKKKKTTKKTTKKASPTTTIKRTSYKHDFNILLRKQKGWCANPKCAKLNRVRGRVTTLRNLDHKYPISLWKLSNKKGNPNAISNLQLLCPNCHANKTALDSKKLSLYKKKHGIKTTKKKVVKKKRKRRSGNTGLAGLNLDRW